MRTQLEIAWEEMLNHFRKPNSGAWESYEKRFGSYNPVLLQNISNHLIENHAKSTFPTVAECIKAMQIIGTHAETPPPLKMEEAWDREFERVPITKFLLDAMRAGYVGACIDDHLNGLEIDPAKMNEYRNNQAKFIASIRQVMSKNRKDHNDIMLLNIAQTMQERVKNLIERSYFMDDRSHILEKYQNFNEEIKQSINIR